MCGFDRFGGVVVEVCGMTNSSEEDARRGVVSERAGSRGPAWPVRGEIEDVLLRVLEGQPELRRL